jgi:hypothetical protein
MAHIPPKSRLTRPPRCLATHPERESSRGGEESTREASLAITELRGSGVAVPGRHGHSAWRRCLIGGDGRHCRRHVNTDPGAPCRQGAVIRPHRALPRSHIVAGAHRTSRSSSSLRCGRSTLTCGSSPAIRQQSRKAALQDGNSPPRRVGHFKPTSDVSDSEWAHFKPSRWVQLEASQPSFWYGAVAGETGNCEGLLHQRPDSVVGVEAPLGPGGPGSPCHGVDYERQRTAWLQHVAAGLGRPLLVGPVERLAEGH